MCGNTQSNDARGNQEDEEVSERYADYFDSAYPEIGREIEEKRQLPDELAEKIVKVAEEFADKSR